MQEENTKRNMKEEGKEEKFKREAFVRGLLEWNQHKNSRKMPWKGEKDPYKIWLSEIILQQTRVGQGLAYYERFIATFPTVQQLANAPEQQVFKLWEGLGYYSRCRNLIAAARFIAQDLNGVFPSDYASILALKGVGPYTAAAISSFAYNLPYAVLDGNVFRVLARIFDVDLPVDTAAGKNFFSRLASDLLPHGQAGIYNQAIMDFGATVCKPMPECAHCFFNQSCGAFLHHRVLSLPVKSKTGAVRERWFHYIVLQWKDQVAIRKRQEPDIWQNLYEPLLVEAGKTLTRDDLVVQLRKSYGISRYQVVSAAVRKTQRLTHQKINFFFLHLLLPDQPTLDGAQWVNLADLQHFPFPRTIQEFVNRNLLM